MFFGKESYTLTVEGMMCKHCAARVTAAVEKTKGAKASVNLEEKTVTVTCPKGTDIQGVIDTLTAEGYKAALK
ncbi:MAG: heavy-metal-associated domain-containing protein [Clostridia bacterium]|nr:heavy-metal-associated domain-containing protein [Clostridia bacterium]